MKTLSILITFIAILAFCSNVNAQEPAKGITKTEVKEGKDSKTPKESKGKTNTKENKGNTKSSSTGEPIPGSEILLEQEPDNKTAPKDNDNHIDDMMLEDDK